MSAARRAAARAQAEVGRRIPPPVIEFLGRHKLGLAITGAIVIALIQTFVSVGMYVNSSTYGLDLSRPDFERAKQEVAPPTPQSTFSPTGPINPEVIDGFNKLYADQSKNLGSSGKYEGTPFGDTELRFTPETSEAPAE